MVYCFEKFSKDYILQLQYIYIIYIIYRSEDHIIFLLKLKILYDALDFCTQKAWILTQINSLHDTADNNELQDTLTSSLLSSSSVQTALHFPL